MAREKKPYRLTRGTHRMPNPNFVQDRDDPESESHVVAQVGDTCFLNDDQYKAFKDKFSPIATDSTDVKDADVAELDAAKLAAVATGQNIDPNKPIAPQIAKAPDPFANARPAAT